MICPATTRRTVSGVVIACELDEGHDGDHSGQWGGLIVEWDYDDTEGTADA